METQITSEKLNELLVKETKRFAEKDGTLKETYHNYPKV